MLKAAIDQTNKKDHLCTEKKLYKNLRKYFKNHISGKLSPFIISSPLLDRFVINFDHSIYRDFKWWDAFSLGIIKTIYKNKSGPIVKMGNHYIGADKFEHLFGRGFKYFEKYYLKGQSLNRIFKFGYRSEKIFLGANTTGVFSYADLSANFNGMRFWNNVLGKHPDILGLNIEPYVKCINQQWTLNNSIDFLHYIDDSFDEAINCSKFRTKKLLSKVKKQIRRLEQGSDKKYSCPINSHSISGLLEKYHGFEKELFNFEGHQSL